MADTAAVDFHGLYDAYHGRVQACVAKLLGPEEADDVTQEVFLKVDRSLGGLHDPAKATSWIFAITLNTVRDVARRRAVRGGHGVAGALCASSPGGRGTQAGTAVDDLVDAASRSPEETAIRHEMIACYVDFVNRLPPLYLEAYVLCEIEDVPVGEAARRLRLEPGTVKMRLHRARARLNEELRRHCRPYRNARGELMAERKQP